MQEVLNQLRELSNNLYWTWNNDFMAIMEEINGDFWKWSSKNPVKFFEAIDKQYLFDIIEKKNLRYRIHNLYRDYRKYITSKETYFEKKYYKTDKPEICYLSAEYGLSKSLKFYSGGLGTLSGDHLKSASDLGIPLVAVGLAYSHGYFRQIITDDLHQSELYEQSDFNSMPMKLVLDEEFRPVKISIDLPGRKLYAQIWQLNIGRIKLYMLDTFVDENTVDDKRITDILYGGDVEKRILQEILLGIGGMRVLEALGIEPKAFHINEGHSAFLTFERIKNKIVNDKVSFREAKDICYYSNIFTTHTPVPAGIDIFPRWMFEKYFGAYAAEELKVDFHTLFAEGNNLYGQSAGDGFNMAYLAINNSNFINGVSKLHGEISRKMWKLPETRTQIDSITNGVHTKTYLSWVSDKVYARNFGKDWIEVEDVWQKIAQLPDEELWILRNLNRKKLVEFVRGRIIDKEKLLHESEDKIAGAKKLLDENALTIGFARRFATYKRGTLILRDIERLHKLLDDKDRKIQLIFSGKAHPRDDGGKNYISEILKFASSNGFKKNIVFIDNYDMEVAKRLVSGCDIWLNNPRRPLEASGTSGMKTIANGGLNFSILDGWWVEGYAEDTGWKIQSLDNEEGYSDEQVNEFESKSLYETLENEIIPMFYDRNEAGLPVNWIKKMRGSISKLAPVFNTGRMVREYHEKFYSKVK
ncbi:MAG: alpha-glucan family phosphorylase [Bacteroidetes bacterium]|nr:alpha-glucan family phosphorylase [Bacteroidota bacterium]